MAWKYFRITSGGSSSTEFNPKEFNILAGTTQCQVGGTITSSRAPMWSTEATVIDGSLTTATYWPAGPNPTCNLTMAAEHADLTSIEIHHTFSHYQHSVWLSENNVDWFVCPYVNSVGSTQYFSIPALPEPPAPTGEPVNWINGTNVTISNGRITKNSGVANGYNAGARGDQDYYEADEVYFEVKAEDLVAIAFGFTESASTESVSNSGIDYRIQLSTNGTYAVYSLGTTINSGNYAIGDIFKVSLSNGNIHFYVNDVLVVSNSWQIYYPIYIDASIYKANVGFFALINGDLATQVTTQNFTESTTENISLSEGAAQDYTAHFEQTAQLNIGMSETAAKEYTAKGYNHNRWTINYLDYYQYADQIYTPKGYAYEQTATEATGLTETGAQEYTANGYEFIGADSQEIIFDFGATQDYTPEGYSFQQNTQENIFVDYVGAQTFTAEGYDVATMAQENILLVSIAAQVYTPNGYNYEATTSETIEPLSQTAAQVFAAHFEQEAQENLNLSMQAAQVFAARFENQAQLNFALEFGASQSYTAIGYSNETSTTEAIQLEFGAAQTFAAHFEQFGTLEIGLGEVTSTEYQANFRANASNTVFVIDTAAQTVVFSEGLQFQENAQENINITYGAAQEFTPFGGYSFSQNGANTVNLSMAASLLYELGETGKFSQRGTLYLYLQESTQTTYTRNWLDFEANAAEPLPSLTMGATSEHTEAHIFEANAAEDLTFFISPLQFYGHYNEANTQENIGLSINATNVYTNVFNEYEGGTLETFYLHHTDKAIHEVNYLSFTQNMYYDFLFWHYADSVHTVGSKDFTARANESTSLSITANVKYTNANMLNGFATEEINLFFTAASVHIEATIYEFNATATEIIDLNLSAASEHIEATIYEFTQLANESIAIAFGAVSEQVKALNANDLLMFEHWATFEVTTEPRNYEAVVELTINLKIVNWVYFESDIYQPTYKIEVRKPNTLWEPTDEDRPQPYIFGRNPFNLVDRRILDLTNVKGPTQTGYNTEISKPNTLYTDNKELERGLMDD